MSETFDLAQCIEHTLLRADATLEDLKKLCEEAIHYNFVGVCVSSLRVKQVSRMLEGSQVKPVAVVGFPLGAILTTVKVQEAYEALNDGAKEIDMVINLGALKDGDYGKVYEDINQVVGVCKGAPVKVIIETAYLNETEKVLSCALAKAAGATFVKTSTGFAGKGATIEDVKLMKSIVGENMMVKASGGIKHRSDVIKMLTAGADRIGTSAGVKIMTEEG